MTDLISRADAIEAVQKDIEFEKEHAIPYEDYDSGCIGGLRKAIRTLEAVPSADAVHKPDYSYEADMVRRLKESRSAEAVPQLKQTDTLIIADALRYLIQDTERHEIDRTRAEELRTQILRYGASMCSSADSAQGWIPIKDGLPKAYKDVMATVWFEDYGDDDDAFEIAFGSLNKFGEWDLRLADGSECIKGFYVQAWQPLPTPYKGGDAK